MNTSPRYHGLSIALHWLMALLILAAIGVGLSMGEMSLSPLKIKLINWHKWVGITVLGLATVRLLWRMYARPPALPATLPAWQTGAAHAMHLLLYVLMFAIPLSGWAMSAAKGFPVVYLGLFPLPDLVAPDEALGDTLADVHSALSYGLIALLVAHVAAALKHHLIDRDDILSRMLPACRRPR